MRRKFGAPSNFIFTLNVDFAALDAQIGCIPSTRSFTQVVPVNTTKIEDIIGKGHTYTFLDPTKKTKTWALNMKQAQTQVVYPPKLKTPVKCWCCHQPFTDNPLGCPLKIEKEVTMNSYYSYAQKKELSLQEEVKGTYFLVEGYLCGWRCLMGYAKSVKHRPECRETIQYIYQMYYLSGGEGIIEPAPHFSMLEEYGGPLTIEKYHDHHDSYTPVNNQYVRLVPVSEIFEIVSKF